MCGICGFTWRDDVALASMVESLHHRGPDAHGTCTLGGVSLGHTRLSILDLSDAGRQPMVDERQQVVVSYNGEIYNFHELRAELAALGHAFRSHSDTEVLLRGYLEWGEDVFPRLNGMWALCLLDLRTRTLLLCRDRLGVKPLYYSIGSSGLAFASEARPLLLLQGSRRLNSEAIDFLMASQFIPSPWSIYYGILKLEPRQLLRYDLETGRTLTRFYYDIPPYSPVRRRAELIEEGRALFENAVESRLVADVPVGAFLSGGLDSTTVVSAMSRRLDAGRVHTVSAGFDLPALDETPYIREAAAAFGTTHHHVEFATADVEDALDEVSRAYDEPVLDPSSLPMFSLCREARRWMTVALSGDGADEMFGGYSSRAPARLVQQVRRLPRWSRRGAHALLRSTVGHGVTGLRGVAEGLRVSLLPLEEYFGQVGSTSVYRPPVFQEWARQRLAELLPLSGHDLLEAVLKFDIHYNRLGDNYCAKVDRMSMAHGLEVRSPFLDYRFVEFASRVPTDWKLDRRHTKILMREIVADHVPQSILTRQKHGFAAPVGAYAAGEIPRLVEGVHAMHEDGVLGTGWRDFLIKHALAEDTQLYGEYRKRFVQLWGWYVVHR